MQPTGQHGVVWYGGELDRRTSNGQVGQLGTHDVRQPFAACAQDPAGEDDERRIEDGDQRGEPERDALTELLQKPVAGSRRGECADHRCLWRAGTQPE